MMKNMSQCVPSKLGEVLELFTLNAKWKLFQLELLPNHGLKDIVGDGHNQSCEI